MGTLGLTIIDVDYTSYCQGGTIGGRDTLIGRRTRSITLFDAANSLNPIPGQQIRFWNAGEVIFGGTISIVRHRVLITGTGTYHEIEAVDYSGYLDRHIIGAKVILTGTTLYDALWDLYVSQHGESQSLAHDGLTFINVENPGPTLGTGDPGHPYLVLSHQSIASAFDLLCASNGRSWYVDEERDIHVFESTVNPAPFDLGDDTANFRELTRETDTVRYRNRQFVRGPSELFPRRIENFDGGDEPWTVYVAVPITEEPIVTIDDHIAFTASAATDVITANGHGRSVNDEVYCYNAGGALPAGLDEATLYHVIAPVNINSFKLATFQGGDPIDITDAGTGTHTISKYDNEEGLQTIGIWDEDQNDQVYWKSGSTAIEKDTDDPPFLDTEIITVTYHGLGANVVMVENTDEITARAGIEGWSGVYEDIVDIAEAKSAEALEDTGEALLAQYGVLPTKIEYETDSVIQADVYTLRVGQFQNVTLTAYGIETTILIDEIEWSDIDGQILVARVHGIDVGLAHSGWREFFVGATGTSGVNAAVSGGLAGSIPPIRFIDGANPIEAGTDLMANHYQVAIEADEQLNLGELMVKLKVAGAVQDLIVDIQVSSDDGSTWNSLFEDGDANKIVVPTGDVKLVWVPDWAIGRLRRNDILRYDVIQPDGSNAEVVIGAILGPEVE